MVYIHRQTFTMYLEVEGDRRIWKPYRSVRRTTGAGKVTRFMHLDIRTKGSLKEDMEPRQNFMSKPNQQSPVYAVEDDVPIPERKFPRRSKYPFGTMSPDQSVEIMNKSYSAIIGVLRKHKAEGKRYAVRKSDNGFRVWRLK